MGHLTTGIAYAFPWHRDTWYSAPTQQVNWWLPIFEVREDNSMSFDLPAFDRAVRNSSHSFDYYQNNAARRHTAAQVTHEQQARPAALDYTPVHDLARAAGSRIDPFVQRCSAAPVDSEHVGSVAIQCRLPHR